MKALRLIYRIAFTAATAVIYFQIARIIWATDPTLYVFAAITGLHFIASCLEEWRQK